MSVTKIENVAGSERFDVILDEREAKVMFTLLPCAFAFGTEGVEKRPFPPAYYAFRRRPEAQASMSRGAKEQDPKGASVALSAAPATSPAPKVERKEANMSATINLETDNPREILAFERAIRGSSEFTFDEKAASLFYQRNPTVRREFESEKAYVEFLRAESRGQVRTRLPDSI